MCMWTIDRNYLKKNVKGGMRLSGGVLDWPAGGAWVSFPPLHETRHGGHACNEHLGHSNGVINSRSFFAVLQYNTDGDSLTLALSTHTHIHAHVQICDSVCIYIYIDIYIYTYVFVITCCICFFNLQDYLIHNKKIIFKTEETIF